MSQASDGMPNRTVPPLPAWARTALNWATTALCGMIGAWLALLIAGTTHSAVGPLSVDASITPAWSGQTVVTVDPIGTLVLDTHHAPLGMQIAVRTVDVDQARELVSHPESLSDLDQRLVSDLQQVLVTSVVRSSIVAVLGGILVTGLLLRSGRRALIAGAITLGLLVASAGAAAITFNPDAVREPRYTGLLSTAPQLVGDAEQIATNFSAYADQLASIVTNVGKLYDTTLSLPTFQPADDTIRLLHVSDLHLNPAAWNVIRAVADQYDVDVIVDTGDIADHGTAPESRYVQPIGTLGRPYVFVRGNHDSILTEAAVADQPNAVVLKGKPVVVEGLRFLGAPDPRFTPDQTTRGTASEDLRLATERLAQTADALYTPADVVVFHDPTHAELLDGTSPLILAGHAHRRQTVVLDQGTRVMVQGSTGGAGLRALEREEPTPVMLSVLYLDPDTKRLLAWDDITLGGLGLTSAEIQRHQADEESGEQEIEMPGGSDARDLEFFPTPEPSRTDATADGPAPETEVNEPPPAAPADLATSN